MKKVLSLLVGLFLASSVFAQRAYYQSFLPSGISSVQVTNTIIITNLTSIQSVGTNITGTVFTNMGVRVISAPGAGDTTPLLSEVYVRPGFGEWKPNYTHNGTNISAISEYPCQPATLVLKTVAGSGANSAVTFTITPVWDVENNLESTAAADAWIFSFTPTASATQVLTTNVPLYRWPGVEKLRAVRIINADTDASSGVEILFMGITGYL